MAAAQTLNSRIRVLIAKTFRAEKLYSSIRSPRTERMSNNGTLAELANDVRAKEWERSHYQLRVALNEILALGSNSSVLAEVLRLRERFHNAAQESSAAIENGMESVVDTVRRQEFAHAFKMCIELVRHKSRAQANKVVADELSAVLEASGRSVPAGSINTDEGAHYREAVAGAELPVREQPEPRSNVIPLRRRFASGGRHFR